MKLPYLILLISCATMLADLLGCSHATIIVSGDPPLMLSQDEIIHSPFCRQHQQWVQVNGAVTAHKGEVVQVLPATQPTK
jgi:hypothetical protein